jgi:hypothetical protein
MANHINDATKYLLESLEESLYAGDYHPRPTRNLKKLLGKLGIKSAKEMPTVSALTHGIALQMESLEATLKQVSFDTKHLSLWKKKP